MSRSNRDDRGRYAPERGTLYPLGRPAFRARVAEMAPERSREWHVGARDGWNPKDGPNPWDDLTVQLPMAIGEVA